jgi:hypothetical protein
MNNSIKVKRYNYTEDLAYDNLNVLIIDDLKEAFIGITENGRAAYLSELLIKILEKKYIPQGFEPDHQKSFEIMLICSKEIDSLESEWNQMFQDKSPVISRNEPFYRVKLKKIKEGKWFDLPL